MAQLSFLMEEIRYGMEIYVSSRTGQQYAKTAFILCDDYVELLSKLWLTEKTKDWKDAEENGRYKLFHRVLDDVDNGKKDHCHPDEHKRIQELIREMKKRRTRRNDFFHSPHLLDLNINKRGCVEAFCDLLDYGELLFGNDWQKVIGADSKLETLCLLFRLERAAFTDPKIGPDLDKVLKSWPRRDKERSVPKKGAQFATHPEDLHLRLCLDWGRRELRDAVKALLPYPGEGSR